jgi:hypothetical protein
LRTAHKYSHLSHSSLTDTGEGPLRFLLSHAPSTTDATRFSAYRRALSRLLTLHPEAAFQEVVETVTRLKVVRTDAIQTAPLSSQESTPMDDTTTSELTSGLTSSNSDSEEEQREEEGYLATSSSSGGSERDDTASSVEPGRHSGLRVLAIRDLNLLPVRSVAVEDEAPSMPVLFRTVVERSTVRWTPIERVLGHDEDKVRERPFKLSCD